jgi:hypothetical protein
VLAVASISRSSFFRLAGAPKESTIKFSFAVDGDGDLGCSVVGGVRSVEIFEREEAEGVKVIDQLFDVGRINMGNPGASNCDVVFAIVNDFTVIMEGDLVSGRRVEGLKAFHCNGDRRMRGGDVLPGLGCDGMVLGASEQRDCEKYQQVKNQWTHGVLLYACPRYSRELKTDLFGAVFS